MLGKVAGEECAAPWLVASLNSLNIEWQFISILPLSALPSALRVTGMSNARHLEQEWDQNDKQLTLSTVQDGRPLLALASFLGHT